MSQDPSRRVLNVIFGLFILVALYFAYLFIFPQKVDVALKWLHQTQFAGMYLAEDSHYYSLKGIDPNFIEWDFQYSPADRLINGEVDFAMMSAEEFFEHVDKGADLTAVAAFYQVSPYALVSLKEKDIVSPADFKGLTLGSKGGLLEQSLIYHILAANFNIDSEELNIVNLDFGTTELEDLILNKADIVEVYRTDQLYFFEDNNFQYNIIYPEEFGVNLNNDLLVVRTDFIGDNSRLIKNFLSATIKGWEKAIERPRQAVEVTFPYITSNIYKDYQYQEYILENSIPLIKPGNATRIGYINTNQMEKSYRTLLEQGFITRDFNPQKYVTNAFLP